jgi:hypothetical protein
MRNVIALSTEPVMLRGEALDEIWWRGQQWAVTAYGIESLDGTYRCDAARLLDNINVHAWPVHMAEKEWVNIAEFTTAWMVALVMHGLGGVVLPARIQKIFDEAMSARDE